MLTQSKQAFIALRTGGRQEKVLRNKTPFCGRVRFASSHNNDQKSEATSTKARFGYEEIETSEKAARVHTVFASVATKYDQMNDVMSAGMHRLWKDYFVGQKLRLNRDVRVLDVAGGTGDIAFRVLEQLWQKPRGRAQVTVLDINQKMLDVGELRASEHVRRAREMRDGRLKWMLGDAEQLPFPDDHFDVYTIAFGIRNCTNRDKVLSEALRVLRPGGQFACLEFSRVENPALRCLYDAYSLQLIPVLGQLIAADFASYRYLVESIRVFPDQSKFGAEIVSTGFQRVVYENLTFGVCAIHTALKPAAIKSEECRKSENDANT